MKLQIFPKRQLTFRTTLTEAEVLERLETHLRQVETGDTGLLTDTFVGEIKGTSFYIHIVTLVPMAPVFIMYLMMRYGFKSGSETARVFIATTFEGKAVE